LVSVPFAQDLRASLCECPECATRFNANYHLRSFDERAMRELLSGRGFSAADVQFIGTTPTYLGYNQIRRFLRPPPPPSYTICPMCGYDDPDGLAAELSRKRRDDGGDRAAPAAGWKTVVKRLWPKRPDPTWIAALYERRS
jgi:hypothetical protein